MPELSNVQTTKTYKKIVIAFSIIVVLLLGSIIYFSLSKTVIQLSLRSQERTVNFTVQLTQETIAEENKLEETVYGFLHTADISESKEFENTNEGTMTDDFATGTVTIYNNWSEVQPLAATTRLLTPDNIMFRIKERVDVPAGEKLESVEVYADQKGSSGNIDSAKFTIPGLWAGLQDKIYAESTGPMTGGQKKASVLTNTLVENAKALFIEELLLQAESSFVNTDNPESSQNKSLRTTLAQGTVTARVDPPVESVTDQFDLVLDMQVVGAFVDENELLDIALTEMKAELSEGEEIASYASNNITFTIDDYNLEQQTATLNVKFAVEAAPQTDHPLFQKEGVVGKTLNEIQDHYATYDVVETVDVQFSPFWVKKAPKTHNQIEISAK